MKKAEKNLFSEIVKLLDFSLTREDIQKFTTKKFANIVIHDKLSMNMVDTIAIIQENLMKLGWIDSLDAVQCPKSPQNNELGQVSLDWAEQIPDGKVVSHGLIMPGSAWHLDYLDGHAAQKKEFVRESMQSLLKIVEVKRKKTLVSFAGENTNKKMPFEAVMLSILFSRYACRHNDPRFLNASFKLNDWCFPKYRKLNNGKPLILFLLALTEQEKCTAELWQ